MSVLVAISGACHSGKTTAIKQIQDKNPDVVVLNEIIRDRVKSIDEIRRVPADYFSLQLEIIQAKITQEDLRTSFYTLADRSLVDSLFYYLTYVEKSALSVDARRSYFAFLDKLIGAIANRYDHIFCFTPIPIREEDLMRPSDLTMAQISEFKVIATMAKGFFGQRVTICPAETGIRMIQDSIDQLRILCPSQASPSSLTP